MTTEVRFHRVLTVLLTAALLATLTVALTGGQRAEAVDGPVEVVYVATGQNFPDALAGANLAATVGAPMLTVNPDLPLPDATTTALQALDPNQIIILGGPVAVSEPVADALADFARSGAVTRIQGGDRHDTAAQIADALPSKVHDADQLDGLDSSAFLRTSADVLERTDVQVGVPLSDVTIDSTATVITSGPAQGLPVSVGDQFDYAFHVPAALGGPVDARVRMRVADANGGCRVDLAPQAFTTHRTGESPSTPSTVVPESVELVGPSYALNDYVLRVNDLQPEDVVYVELQRLAVPAVDCSNGSASISLVAIVVDWVDG